MPLKIGDRVVCVGENSMTGNEIYGFHGTVVCIAEYRVKDMYGVQFDCPIEFGHNAAGQGEDGHCWYLRSKYLEKEKSPFVPATYEELLDFIASV